MLNRSVVAFRSMMNDLPKSVREGHRIAKRSIGAFYGLGGLTLPICRRPSATDVVFISIAYEPVRESRLKNLISPPDLGGHELWSTNS